MRNYLAADNLLADRVVLVTGADSGIGRAASRAFARYGATVVLLGRNRSNLEHVYDDIEANGSPRPAMIECDLERAGADDFAAVADTLAREFGRLDGLLHSAAELGVLAPIELYDASVWDTVLRVNLTAPFLLTRTCLPLLKRAHDASIVFTTADVGRRARAYWGAYAAAAFALEGLAQTLADELVENTHVRVNTVDPGAVRTDFRRRAFPGEDPLAHPPPEEIMGVYLYLMGPDSRGVTAQALSAWRA